MDMGCDTCAHADLDDEQEPCKNCWGCLSWEPVKVVPGDNVNYPAHYNTSDIQPIVAIEAWGLNFRLGNVIKYVARHKHKNGLEDLKKALYYLDREIEQYERDV
jgi:hypothetical protein